MTSRKWLALASLISVLGIYGCNESVPYSDIYNDKPKKEKCDVNTYVPECVTEQLYVYCNNGVETTKSCKSCSGNVCEEETTPECDADVCDGTLIKRCSEGRYQTPESCGNNKVCQGGQCVQASQPGEDCSQNKCDTSGNQLVCSGGHYQDPVSCGDGKHCEDGDCVNDAVNDRCTKTGTSTSKYVLKGDVLAPDGSVIEHGSVVVEGNHITYVGLDPDTSDATIIDCPDSVISPGLINAHDHITYDNQKPGNWGDERFDHRLDWRKGKYNHSNQNADNMCTNGVGGACGDTPTSEMRQLVAGVTSIFGSGKAAGLQRNLDQKDAITGVTSAVYQTFPLDDGGLTSYLKSCPTKYKADTDTEGYYGPHIGEGINDTALLELNCLSGTGQNSKDIFTDKLAIIHGVAATPAIMALMASRGSKLIWSPRTNISLYGNTAQVPVYDRLGVTIALGTDWTASGSVNMLREFACIDFLNTHYYDNYFTDEQIWRMATANGAEALGFDKYLGALERGKLADIAMYATTSTKKAHRAVLEANSGDVLFVMVDGKIVFGDENIVPDFNGCETDTACGIKKKICPNDANKTYGAMKAAAEPGFYFCGEPEGEPTCIPSRKRAADVMNSSTVYDGGEGKLFSDPDDMDGDGIPNDQDNCPKYFNPVRPMDNAVQANADGDEFGDMCDPYPLCPDNNSSCPVYNPDVLDTDGDNIPDKKDNCPTVANENQDDTDLDGIGDACDPCPNDGLNEDGKGCPLSVTPIKDIRDAFIDGSFTEGPIKVEGIVTAIASKYDASDLNGFFIQDEANTAGIYVYSSSDASNVAIGDLVVVKGSTQNYNNLLEV